MEVTPPAGGPDREAPRRGGRTERTGARGVATGRSRGGVEVPAEPAERPDRDVSPRSVGVALVGFAIALFGVYWDDAWHTDRGRDDLLSAPHLALYSGVTVAVAVVGWWGWRRRETGWRRVLAGPIGVAVTGAAVTLGSAPVDEWWHSAFGRDAVIWSPPHLVALVGTIALGTGVALVAGQAARADGTSTVLAVATGAGVIGAWQILVLEYDTDVAQFAAGWYLPVLAVAVAAASATVHAAVGHRVRWAAVWAGVTYTAAMVAVIVVLSATDFSTPIVPAVVPALLAADISRQLGWRVSTRTLLLVAALFGTYVPYLRSVDGGVPPSTTEVLWGVAVAVAGVGVVFTILAPSARRNPVLTPRTLMIAIVVTSGPLVVADSRQADAHDPGQGVEVAGITLTADVTGDRVRLIATPDGTDSDIEPVRLVARRAGRLVVGELSQDGAAWSGAIELDERGRWFVYAEARRDSERLEAWIPVIAGSDGVATKHTELYIGRDDTGATAGQIAAGIVLLSVALAIVGRLAVAIRAENLRQLDLSTSG